MYRKIKKLILDSSILASNSITKLDLSLPNLLGHNTAGLKTSNTTKKYPVFLEKSFKILDAIVSFILNKDTNNTKISEVIKIAWGPLFVGVIIMVMFFGVFGIWAAVAPLDGAVPAIGEVVLSSNRQVIQHLEGGIIDKILVREGDQVQKNQPLIYLQDTSAKANLGILQEKMLVLVATEARLFAIRDDLSEINFPEEINSLSKKETVEKVIENQKRLFTSYKNTTSVRINILQQRIKQLKNELSGSEAQLKSANEQYKFIEEELETKRKLLSDGYISKPHILSLEKQYADIQGKVGYYKAAVAQSQQKIGENELEIINIKNSVQEKVNAELKETSAAISDLRERINSAQDVLKRTVIRSPQNGTVTGLKYHTEGGVITPGSQIMDIVPADDELIIDAKIQTRNIEEILTAQKQPKYIVNSDNINGLKVKVRLSAYSARKVSLIDGIVTQVSADAFSEHNGMRYYLIRVVIPKENLKKFKYIRLYPGMPAEVYIITQSRTLLEYLFTPIVSTFEKAFKER